MRLKLHACQIQLPLWLGKGAGHKFACTRNSLKQSCLPQGCSLLKDVVPIQGGREGGGSVSLAAVSAVVRLLKGET